MKKSNFVLLTFLFLLMPFSLFADIEDNDNCSQAELISAMHNKAEINYSTSVTGTVQNSDDDYYYFTVTQSGTIEINYTSTNSTDLRIQAGVTCSSTITRVMANNTQYNGTLNVTAGQTVYIRIQRISGSPNYTLNLNFTADFSTSNTRDFTLVSGFPYNIKGDIQIIGNSVTLKADTMDCAPIGTNNNGFTIAYADKDSNAATFNSTSADITLPKGVTKIKYAGLYWQGRTQTPTIMAQGTTTKIRFPHDSNYQTVTTDSSKFNWYTETGITDSSTGKLYSYQGVANVTSLLQADINKVSSSIINSTGYSASIWVADVVTEVGMLASLNGYGAWSLVIVYEDSAGTLKNISTYDGFRLLKVKPSQNNINETLTQTLSGFYTPPSGAVNSKFLLFGGEGDAGDDPRANSGYNDNASLSNKTGTDVLLGTDVFNGTETDINGNNITTRNPACANTIGIDIHTYDVGTSSSKYPIIGNSQTSTTIKLTPATNEDSYLPGVFAFSTDIYTPKLCYVENIFRGNENISGQNVQVNADENLTVRVYVTNTDNAAAQKVQILHQFDSSFPYVNNSTNYNNLNPTYQTVMPPSYARTTATDIKGDDLFEYNSTSFVAKINLGTGATSSSGGTFSDNNKTTAVFEYKATVKSSQNYKTTYQVAYVNSALNIDYSNNPVEISSCDGTANSFFGYSFSKQGNVDAVDNISNGYTAAMGLQTKIANKSNYTVDAIWLGSGTTPTNYIGAPQGGGLPVTISLSDNTCSSDESLSVTGGPVEAIIPKGDYKGTSSTFTISNKAKKNAKLRFRFIDWSNLATSKAINCFKSSTFSSLEKVPACFASDVKIEDAFGIEIANQCTTSGARPACQTSSYNAGNLPSPPYDNIYGCFNCLADALNGAQCSTDNFAIRPNDFNSTITVNQQFIADQNTSVTFYANQYNGTGTTDYNETMNNSFKVDVNISDTTKVCTAPSILFSPAVTFTNGVVTGTYSLPNVGDFNMTIHEISGSEYALVDADDTPDAQRFISPFTRQIKVVPNSFTIDGNFTNGGNGFTYLSNFETYPNPADRNISALLDLNISARSATNAILSNYTSLCYAKDANLTINTATVGNTLTGLNKLLWYDRLHDLNGSIALANISSYTMPLDNTQFDSTDANGTAQVQYLVNFDRNMSKTVQPFIFNISDINTSNEDNRTGTKTFINQSATYYYGRAFAPDYTFIGRNGIATIYYEVYCRDCTATYRTTMGIDGNESVRAVNWYQNTDHNSTYGIAAPIPLQSAKFSSYPVTNGSAPISTQTFTLQNSTNLPFTDTINLNSSNWLIYYPTYYTVSFISSGAWAGEGSVSSTNKVGATVDANTTGTTRTQKRIDW